jgi:hypothetical protein
MSNGRYSASVDQLSQHLIGSAARRRDQPSTRSPALRYWNLAQQRHYRRSAPCRRAMPVSGDCAARHDPHTRGKRPGFRPRQANSRERRTVCWREMDSNHRFRARGAIDLSFRLSSMFLKLFVFCRTRYTVATALAALVELHQNAKRSPQALPGSVCLGRLRRRMRPESPASNREIYRAHPRAFT